MCAADPLGVPTAVCQHWHRVSRAWREEGLTYCFPQAPPHHRVLPVCSNYKVARDFLAHAVGLAHQRDLIRVLRHRQQLVPGIEERARRPTAQHTWRRVQLTVSMCAAVFPLGAKLLRSNSTCDGWGHARKK
eukprot:3227585-Rhodomonas_salina.2